MVQFKQKENKQKLLEWWDSLDDDTGGRAALRRCREPVEALFIPAYHRLFWALENGANTGRLNLPAIAALCANVRKPVSKVSLPVQMASPGKAGGDSPALSELRFRRLLQCSNIETLFPALRRTIHLLGNNLDIVSLAESVYYWNSQTRKRWSYDYYGQLNKKSK